MRAKSPMPAPWPAQQESAWSTSVGSLLAVACHGPIERGNIDLAHVHHRRERALRRLPALRHQFGQPLWRDLPGHAEAVLAPAARTFLASAVDDGFPVTVGLGL